MITRQDYDAYVYMHSDLVLTAWNEGDDIKTYKGNKNIYVEKLEDGQARPEADVEADVASYYEISEEQHFAYERQRAEAEGRIIPE